GDVDDGKPAHAEPHPIADEEAVVVRAAVPQRIVHRAQDTLVDGSTDRAPDPSDAAHQRSLPGADGAASTRSRPRLPDSSGSVTPRTAASRRRSSASQLYRRTMASRPCRPQAARRLGSPMATMASASDLASWSAKTRPQRSSVTIRSVGRAFDTITGLPSDM